MKEYKLITGDHPKLLSQAVNDHLADGWMLYGFPYSVVSDSGSLVHYQAMTL